MGSNKRANGERSFCGNIATPCIISIASEQLNQTDDIFDNYPLILILLDEQRHVQKVNHAATEFIGCSSEETAYQRAGEMLHCLHAQDDPKGCGFGYKCHNCSIYRNVEDTFETGRCHYRVHARISVVHGRQQTDVELLLSIMPVMISGNKMVLLCLEQVDEKRKALQALLDSEEKYRQIVSTTTNAIMILDAETERFIEVNNACLDLYGYNKQEFLELQQDAISADRKTSNDPIEKTLTDIPRHIPLCYHKKKDGTIFPVEISLSSFDLNGRRVLCSVVRDITAHKRIEKQLRESEQRFRNIINALPMGMHMYRLKDGGQLRFVGYNPAADKMLGVDNKRYLGATIEEAFPELANTEIPQRYREIAKHGKIWADEPIFYHNNDVRCIYAFYTFQSSPGEMAALFMDITESKKAEVALKKSEAFNKKVLESSLNGIYIYDITKENNVYINREYTRITGYTLEDLGSLERSQFLTLFHPEDLARIQKHMKKLNQAKDGDVLEVEYRFKKNSGDWIWCLARDSVFERDDDGNLKQVIGAVMDITNKKQTEEQLKSLTSQLIHAQETERERLAIKLHDDISQRLAMTKFWLQSLMAGITKPATLTFIDEIYEQIDGMIEDAHSLIYELDNPLLKELGLEAALKKYLRDEVQGKFGIRYEFEFDHKIRQLTPELKSYMFRNIRELCSNTIKYARASKINVSIQRLEDCVRVSVEDDGIGFKVDNTHTLPDPKGGFGLFSLRTQLEKRGGHVKIATKSDHGTKVTLDVPFLNKR